ncbi:GNAT family N-acetyltransferase [Intrasporangium flavum]|uniref:GNAT family N-acetyltransferase n=1 Tax=Intrasporangium flavum TaxID=1428657 RepID=UPI00096CECCA|nr:GNAT family N-acetyltransferase [Intrasporangium flavum]
MIETRRLQPADRPRWETLFRAYIAFYERTLDDAAYDRAWREIASGTRLHGLGAWLDGELVGITHFLVHPSSSEPDLCYLEDLFTVPEARGHGVASALVEAVGEWARTQGCGSVYWQTHEANATARRLYDRLARYEGFVVYTMPLG